MSNMHAHVSHSVKLPERKTLIVGLGKTGLSCARYLAAQGFQVAITDTRDNPPELARLREELPDAALFLGGFRPEIFAVAEQLVVSPGVPLTDPLVRLALDRGVPVLGDIELFARVAQAPVVAVTGSNGKSTVVTLLGEMAQDAGLRAGVGGNLGEPALDLLNSRNRLYMLELSSFQLETTHSLQARAAVVLNLSPDHMDRYPSLDAYGAAKARIYQGAEWAVVNRDDPSVPPMAVGARHQVGFTLGRPEGRDFGIQTRDGQPWLAQGDQFLLPAGHLLIPGRHNLANALAALALGDAAGLPMESMLGTLRQFRGLPHRTQWVAEKRGVRWYNDSKGTNVGATLAALEGLHQPGTPGRALLIAGGDGKGADFSSLAPVVERTCKAVLLIGRDAPLMAEVLAGRAPLVQLPSLNAAVLKAAQLAEAGDYVLLSPACASFDMFRGFEHRGQAFVEAVGRLPA